ncbi:MAG TPA: recombination mediator RecR [Candidatus Paceibacterota bacterium]
MNNVIEKLTEAFTKFPGIGPRQAKRFVYFLLSQDGGKIKQFVENIKELRENVSQCPECFRYFIGKKSCTICADPNIENDKLLIIEKDADLENIRKTNKYHGRYFVLGGLLPILEKEPESRIRILELRSRIKALPELKEVILALSANPVGENTSEYLHQELAKFANVKISSLGRGISTGSELEYADSATLSSALESRR